MGLQTVAHILAFLKIQSYEYKNLYLLTCYSDEIVFEKQANESFAGRRSLIG